MEDSSKVFRMYSGIAFTDVSLLFLADISWANVLLSDFSLLDSVLNFSVVVERFNSVVVANVFCFVAEVFKIIAEV